jgi:hypothetical protein
MKPDCNGCSYLDYLNGCLIEKYDATQIENCPCGECIIKIICSRSCENRMSLQWFDTLRMGSS